MSRNKGKYGFCGEKSSSNQGGIPPGWEGLDDDDEEDEVFILKEETRQLSKEEEKFLDYWTDKHFTAANKYEGIESPADDDFTDDIYNADPPEKVDPKSAVNVVWWDVNTFPLSNKRRATRIVSDIQQWLQAANGYFGRVVLYAYGDMNKMEFSYLWRYLEKAKAQCTHVPYQASRGAGGLVEGACFYKMFQDITITTLAHPPPANMMIISDDHRFEAVGLGLEEQCYECILARRSPLPHDYSRFQVIWKDIGREFV